MKDLNNKAGYLFFTVSILISFTFYNFNLNEDKVSIKSDSLIFENEKHFKNLRQLTFGGENAECYFSFDGKKFTFQTTRDGLECDQIYTMNIDGTNQTLASTGKGRTTCAYYFPDNKSILYSSTHLSGDDCPPKPDFSKGYVWALYDSFDIFASDESGSDIRQLTSEKGYDAEATFSQQGDKIVFTSTRNGDIDIYSMNPDGTDVTQLTFETGYDGGPFYSYDGKKIVYRKTRFENEDEVKIYKELLSSGLIKPSKLEIWIMDSDGSNKKQVTNNSSANFAPYFFPDNERIVFCSNIDDPKSRNFDIYKINIDGSGLERITYCSEFDGFPMFSPDGKKFVFCSNRYGSVKGETNVFICDWVE